MKEFTLSGDYELYQAFIAKCKIGLIARDMNLHNIYKIDKNYAECTNMKSPLHFELPLQWNEAVEYYNLTDITVNINVNTNVTKCFDCPLCYIENGHDQYCNSLKEWINEYNNNELTYKHGNTWVTVSKLCPFLNK